MTICGCISIRNGVDASFDLENYHIYNPFALLHNRYMVDVAPAQIQSYFNPLLDLPFYFLISVANDRPRLIAFLIGSIQGLNVTAVMLIAWHCLRIFTGLSSWMRVSLTMIALWIGISGAGTVPLIGATTGDIPVAVPLLWGLYALLRGVDAAWAGERSNGRNLLIAGILIGVAAGAKLTMAPYGVAMVVALVALPRHAWLRGGAMFLAGSLAGFLIAGGPHLFHMISLFDNPTFPFMNDIFHSPYWEDASTRDERFIPKGVFATIALPFNWALHVTQGDDFGAELPFRDVRIALVLTLGALLLILKAGARLVRARSFVAVPPCARVLIIFTIVPYALWLHMFGIYRYLVPLEMLSGTLIVMAIGALARPAWLVLALAVALLCHETTVPLDWGHVGFGERYVDVSTPVLPPDTLVAIVGQDPVSYFIPFARKDATWISLNNNFLRIGQHNRLIQRAHALIARHDGPLMVLYAGPIAGTEAVILETYGISSDGKACQTLTSNLASEVYDLCQAQKK